MTNTQNNILALFPGQGAQYIGMGEELYNHSQKFRAYFEEASDLTQIDLKEVCFNGPAETLNQTLYSQLALLVTSVAIFDYFKSLFPEKGVSAVAGLSLGEYSACVAAGVLSFPNAVQLVQHRASLMQECSQQHNGKMVSIINLPEDDYQGLVQAAHDQQTGVLVLANYNSPRQIVLSGDADMIHLVGQLAQERGAMKVIELAVGGAFHSPHMNEASEKFSHYCQETEFKEPQCTFYSNVTGQKVSSAKEIQSLLSQQIISPVKWSDIMRHMDAEYPEIPFMEFGAGKVCTGLVKRNCRRHPASIFEYNTHI